MNRKNACLLGVLFAFSLTFCEFRCDTTIISLDTAVICSSITKSGTLRAIYRYLNGETHDKQIAWHPNGQIKYKANYFHGKNVDTSFGYYNSGKIERISPYNGMFTYFSPEGDTLSIGPVYLGKSIGLHRQYFSANHPQRFIHYDSTGQKHGWEVFWYENGNVKDSTLFKKGYAVSGKTFYLNGKVNYWEKEVKGRTLKSAISYNQKGKKTGEVINGNGVFFICDSIGGNCKKLEFKDGKRVFK